MRKFLVILLIALVPIAHAQVRNRMSTSCGTSDGLSSFTMSAATTSTTSTSTTTTTTTLVPDIVYLYNMSVNETPQTNEIGAAFNMVVDGASFNAGNGGYYDFTGADSDNMDSGTAMSEVAVAQNFTISCWFKSVDNSDNYQTAVAVSAGSSDRILLGTGSVAHRFMAVRYDGSYTKDCGDWNWANDTWYHLLMTHTSGGDVQLWVNSTNQSGTAGSPSTSSTVGTTFGNRTSESIQALDGAMDEVIICDSVLSAANILVLYEHGATTK